jgi:hypothetical protein
VTVIDNNYYSEFLKSSSPKEGYNNLSAKIGKSGCLLFSSEKN